MRLGIDLDGVVANFNAGWLQRYNRDFGTELGLDAVSTWNGIPAATHFDSMHDFWEWARHLDGASLFRVLDPYPNAVESLWQLAKAGHKIVILTSKPYWATHHTYEWIAEHELPTREVHILDDKWRVDCDVYLDDAPHNVEDIHQQRPNRATVRYIRPWNDPVSGTHSIANWDEFLAFVDGYQPQKP